MTTDALAGSANEFGEDLKSSSEGSSMGSRINSRMLDVCALAYRIC